MGRIWSILERWPGISVKDFRREEGLWTMGREQSRRDRFKSPGSGRGCCPDFRLEHLVLHSLSPEAEYHGHRPLLRTRAYCLQAQEVLTTESWQQSRWLGKAIFPRVAWPNDQPTTQHAPIKDQSQLPVDQLETTSPSALSCLLLPWQVLTLRALPSKRPARKPHHSEPGPDKVQVVFCLFVWFCRERDGNQVRKNKVYNNILYTCSVCIRYCSGYFT